MTTNRILGSTIATGALVLASLGVFAGVADADPPPFNYGGCVSPGSVFPIDPSTSPFGPFNLQAADSSGRNTGAYNGSQQSGGQSRYQGGAGCANGNGKTSG